MLETSDMNVLIVVNRCETMLDLSGGDQTYIEDCPVCCRPITFSLQIHGEDWTLEVLSENE